MTETPGRPAISTEYLRVTITDVDGLDLSGTVELALIGRTSPATEPGDDDWHTAAWADDTAAPSRVAQLLTGPDTDPLLDYDPDAYEVWYHLPDTPEDIRRPAGTYRIT